ncbi:MAG: RtcB family protein [Coriobacteriia bacterium]
MKFGRFAKRGSPSLTSRRPTMWMITTESVPILVWARSIDDGTVEQAKNLANLPFAFHHVALMADAHVGFGMPIGGVLAARGQILPHAVGLDIGCGVRAWRTNVSAASLMEHRDRILNDIQRSVPQGFEWHRASQASRTSLFDDVPRIPALSAEIEKAQRQVGSLGGGNHFIELQEDPEGIVWAMVHTGSRNIGKQVAQHYNQLAREVNRRSDSLVPPEWGLAHLEFASDAGQEYFSAMGWCLRFAQESRRLIAEEVQRAIDRHFPDVQPGSALDVHHNYASVERHFGEEVVVHRKGAVRASGTVFIPGSMGTASYVGEGLAEPDSFESCSHGAGRALGRKEAMRAFQTHEVLAELEERGVRLFKAHKADVAEEAPEAYKDIEDVMELQSDLVRPMVRLRPIGVVKG